MKRFWFKKDGFSLVELLATVVILGLLSVVAIVSVNALLKRAEQTHYATLEKNLIMAAESYALDNRSVLPKKVGDTVTITLAQLQSKKEKLLIETKEFVVRVKLQYLNIHKKIIVTKLI